MIDDSTRLRQLHMPGSITVLGAFVAISLTAAGVARHPESVQGAGKRLLQIEIALLLAYGLAESMDLASAAHRSDPLTSCRNADWRPVRRRACRESHR